MAAPEQSIKAFENYDSSVFLSWLEAVGDIMMGGGDPSSKESVANLGGMIYALSMAAQELQERERKS